MRTIVRMVLLAAAVLPVSAIAADSVRLTPGRWQITLKPTSLTIGTSVAPASQLKDDIQFDCVNAKQAANPFLYFQNTDPKVECEPAQGSAANGKYAITQSCTAKDPAGTFTEISKGTYTSRSYQGTMQLHGTMGSAPIVTTGTVEGHFVGQCKGDEEG